ncbi:matrixin family metalloprotease [Myxococcota bacterium]|nr:matrixin family metalloprotease [Myxococcota bacterium]
MSFRSMALAYAPALGTLLGWSSASAYALKTTDDGQAIRWHDAFGYAISSAGARDLDDGRVVDAVHGAFAPWLRVDGARLSISYAGRTETPVGFDPGSKNVNTIAWSREAWPFEPDALAMTVTAHQQSTGRLVDGDILINEADYSWGLGGAAENDLVNALTHEVGHLLGLAHSDVPEATMFARAEPWETQKTTLAADDEAGLRALYPAPRTSASTLAVPATTASADPEVPSAEASAPAPTSGSAPEPPRIKIRAACSQSAGESAPSGAGGLALLLFGALLRRRAMRALAAVSAVAWLLPAAAQATMVHALTLEDLTVRATDIVEGTVVEQTSRRAGGYVVTDVAVRVDACHKGGCSADVVVVQVFGGQMGAFVVSAAGAATYETGEQVLLFLEPVASAGRTGESRFRTPGLALGKFRLAWAGDLPAAERDLRGLELLGEARVDALGESRWALADLRARIAALLSP